MLHHTLRLALVATTGLCSTVMIAAPALAQNLPTGPSIGYQSGADVINFGTSGTTGTLNLGTNQRSIVNWTGFDVGTGYTMQLQYGGAGQGAVLNRVVGGTASNISGALNGPANLDVFLLNSNGIVFGPSSTVNVGGLIASTLGLADADFVDGSPYNFSGTGTTTIGVGSGSKITTTSGPLALIAGSVVNNGTLTSAGDMALVAASDVTMAMSPGSPLSMTIRQGTPISNSLIVSGVLLGRNIYLGMATKTGVTGGLLNVVGSLVATTATATDRGVVLAAGTSANGITVETGGGSDTGGSARMTLNGNIRADEATAPANAAVEVRSSGSVTGGSRIYASDDVNLSSASSDVLLTGGLGGVSAGKSITATASGGTVGIQSASTGTGPIDFAGNAVQLSNATISANNGSVTLTGATSVAGDSTVTSGPAGDVTFNSAVNGAANLTVRSGGTIRFTAGVGQTTALTSLFADGPTVLGSSVRTSGSQLYFDAVTLGAPSVLLQSTAGGDISLNSNVDGASALTINTAGLTRFFSGNVGATTALTSLTTDAAGTTQIRAASIKTTGAQAYGDNVTLAANTTLQGTNFSAPSISGSGYDLALNFSGTTAINGATMLGVRNLSTGGGGTTSLTGAIQTTGLQNYESATLAGSTVLTSSGTAAAGNVAFNGTLDGASALTVNTAGTTSFNGAVGGTTALTSLTTDAAGTNVIGSHVTTSGAQSYSGATSLTAGTHRIGGTSVTFNGAVNAAPADLVTLRVNATGAGAAGLAKFMGAINDVDGLAVDAGAAQFNVLNRIGTLALNLDLGGYNFANSGLLTIGTVDGLSGITLPSGDSYLSSTGGVALQANVVSPGLVYLRTDSGAITQAAGTGITTNWLSLSAGSFEQTVANVALTGNNDVNTLDGYAYGSFLLNNNGALTTMGLTGATGVSVATTGDMIVTGQVLATHNGNVTLGAGGNLTLENNISAAHAYVGPGDVTLTAGGLMAGATGKTIAANNIALTADDWTNGILGAAMLQEQNNLSITDTAGGLTASALTGISAANRLTIETQGGNLTVGGVAAGGAIDLLTSGDLLLNDNIGAAGDTLTLTSGGNISQIGGIIDAATLTGSSVGQTGLGQMNMLGSLGGFSSSLFFLRDGAGGLAVTGPVTGTTGAAIQVYNGGLVVNAPVSSSAGYVSLLAAGPNSLITLNAPVSASTGVVELLSIDAGGTIAQSAGADITASTLSVQAGIGAILNNAGNSVGTLNHAETPNFSLVNSGALVIDGPVGSALAGSTFLVRTLGGPLTIASPTTIRGANVMLSTDGLFTNLSGSDAIQLVSGGKWAVYAATPTGSSFGGLNSANTAIWNASYGSVDPASISGNRYIFAYQPTLTVTTLDASKVYGTDLSGSTGSLYALSGLHAGVAGAFLGDSAASVYSGAPLISSAGLAERASVAGGPYAVTASAGSLTMLNGYALAFDNSGAITATPKALNAVVAANDKTYDGTTAASGMVSLAGVVNGDTVNASALLAFANKNAGSNKTVTITGGSLSGTDAGNYTLTLPASTLADILQRGLVIAANDLSKVAGTPDPALTYSLVSGNLVAGDSLTGNLNRAPGEAAGLYGVNQGSLTAGQNYAITYHAGELTIAAVPAEPQVAFSIEPLRATPLPAHIKRLARSGSPITIQPGIFCSPQNPCPAK